jgi:hypothetical protein
MGSRGGDRGRERERERERERGSNRRWASAGGAGGASGYGSSTSGRRCDFRWPEPTFGEAGTVLEVLLVCVLHNFIWYNMLMCLFSIRGIKGLVSAKSEPNLFPILNILWNNNIYICFKYIFLFLTDSHKQGREYKRLPSSKLQLQQSRQSIVNPNLTSSS